MKKTIIWPLVSVFVVLFVILLLFLIFEGSKKLTSTNYILFEGDDGVDLCFYEGDREGGIVVTRKPSLYKVLWNEKYILAYAASPYKPMHKTYYIIEQLETDTFVVRGKKKIPWTTYHEHPWITEEYETYEGFNQRLRRLNIDTTQMNCYTWKYWVGIY